MIYSFFLFQVLSPILGCPPERRKERQKQSSHPPYSITSLTSYSTQKAGEGNGMKRPAIVTLSKTISAQSFFTN